MLCKYPEAGKVKTRLGEKIGMQEAAIFQEEMITKACNTFWNRHEYDFHVHMSPHDKGENFSRRFNMPLDTVFCLNNASYLGDKMYTAMNQYTNTYDNMLLIGSDIPTITNEDIKKGIELLETWDVIFGPAKDWGYYLVGSKGGEIPKQIFQNIVYSTETVLRETLEVCKASDIKYGLLREQEDIDTIESYQKYTKHEA